MATAVDPGVGKNILKILFFPPIEDKNKFLLSQIFTTCICINLVKSVSVLDPWTIYDP